jgi:4,5-dihydroxyphthalate decarboxylase
MACLPSDRTQALQDGTVRIEGVDLTYVPVPSAPEIFARMVRGHAFDVAEMSLAHYLTMRTRGEFPYIALPVFPSRVFRHGFIYINRNAGIRVPKDLEGKRIGLRDHRHTAAVWIRGTLTEEYGVSFDAVQWYEGGVNTPRPRDVVMEILPDGPLDTRFVDAPKTLSDMLADGEIDAIVGAIQPHSFGRSPDVARLFPDPGQVERDYFRRTAIFPIMHTLVIPDALNERRPWVAESIYKAMEEAKYVALTQRRRFGALRYMFPWLAEHVAEIDGLFGGDAWPYGVDANRHVLDTFIGYLVAQGYIGEARTADGYFTPIVGQSQLGPRGRH